MCTIAYFSVEAPSREGISPSAVAVLPGCVALKIRRSELRGRVGRQLREKIPAELSRHVAARTARRHRCWNIPLVSEIPSPPGGKEAAKQNAFSSLNWK